MTATFVAKFSFSTRPTNISAQKIDRSAFKTYKIVIVGFLISEKSQKIQFLRETFLSGVGSIDFTIARLFLAFGYAKIVFNTESLIRKTHSSAQAFISSIIIELINKHKFAKSSSDKSFETFVIHVISIKSAEPTIHVIKLSWKLH